MEKISVDEAKELKRQLERDIARLLQDFANKTHICPHGVDVGTFLVNRVDGGEECYLNNVSIKCYL